MGFGKVAMARSTRSQKRSKGSVTQRVGSRRDQAPGAATDRWREDFQINGSTGAMNLLITRREERNRSLRSLLDDRVGTDVGATKSGGPTTNV